MELNTKIKANKQTAVSWLIEIIENMMDNGGDLGEDFPALEVHLKTAKEKETQQIYDDYNQGYRDCENEMGIEIGGKDVSNFSNAQYHYEHTYADYTLELCSQDNLTPNTLIYNFETNILDTIVRIEKNTGDGIAISADGLRFHPSANALGGGWKVVTKKPII
jgi:hypothetical protein